MTMKPHSKLLLKSIILCWLGVTINLTLSPVRVGFADPVTPNPSSSSSSPIKASSSLTQLNSTHVDGFTPPSHPSEVINWEVLSTVQHNNNFVVLTLKLTSTGGFHLYQNRLKFSPPLHSTLVQTHAPETVKLDDPVTAQVVDVYKEGYFELILQLNSEFLSTQPPSELGITYLGCSEYLCLLPYTEHHPLKIIEVDHPYELTQQPTNSSPPQLLSPDQPNDHFNGDRPTTIKDTQLSWDHRLARQLSSQGSSLWWLLLLCLIGGLLTNLTPCVYPMIPITLRALGDAKSRKFNQSLHYAGGIFTMYTVLGLVAAFSGSVLGGASASNYLNLALAAFLTWMSLSMLGYTHLNFIQRLGAKLSAGNSSSLNRQTYLMGLSAGFVAAPCTGPILAGLMSYSFSHLTWLGSLATFSTYSLGFAAPYILIGPLLGAIVTKKIPPVVLKAVKLIMASLIMGLALYYLRLPLYELIQAVPASRWAIITWLFGILGLGMGIAALTAQIMQHRRIYQLVPTIMLAVSLFAFTQLLGANAKSQLNWHNPDIAQLTANLESPTLVALWAEWCTACKIMESTTFSHPEIINYLEDQTIQLVKYDVTTLDTASKLILDTLGVQGLPAYVLMSPPIQDHTPQSQLNLQGLYEPQHFLQELKHFFNPQHSSTPSP